MRLPGMVRVSAREVQPQLTSACPVTACNTGSILLAFLIMRSMGRSTSLSESLLNSSVAAARATTMKSVRMMLSRALNWLFHFTSNRARLM